MAMLPDPKGPWPKVRSSMRQQESWEQTRGQEVREQTSHQAYGDEAKDKGTRRPPRPKPLTPDGCAKGMTRAMKARHWPREGEPDPMSQDALSNPSGPRKQPSGPHRAWAQTHPRGLWARTSALPSGGHPSGTKGVAQRVRQTWGDFQVQLFF
jgi:hypothetical protein